jgi:parvulin-like peptidyl-prolyl isomerase
MEESVMRRSAIVVGGVIVLGVSAGSAIRYTPAKTWFAAAPALASMPGTGGDVVAVVNGAPITADDLEIRLDSMLPLESYHGHVEPDRLLSLRRAALDDLVLDEMIYREAIASGRRAPPEAVAAEMSSVRARFDDPGQFEAALRESGLTERAFRERLERAVLVREAREAHESQAVSDAEIAGYYQQNASKFLRPERVHLVEVLFRTDPADPSTAVAAREKALQVLNRVNDGEDLGAIASALSEDEYRVKDGDMGWVHRGRLDADFESLVFAAEPGRLEIARSIYGFEVFKVLERQPPRQLSLDEARPIIESGLEKQKREEALREWRGELLAGARVEIRDLALRDAQAAPEPAAAPAPPSDTTAGSSDPGPSPNRSTTSRPPEPVGEVLSRRPSLLGEWIVPRALRASLHADYESSNVGQTAGGNLEDRHLGGGATLVGSVAVLDPRVLSVDFAGDFQMNSATSQAYSSSVRNRSGVQSYRLELGVLSGLRAPLRVWVDRLMSTSSLQPSGATADSLRLTRGVRNGAGFTWDIEPNVMLPHVQVSASTARQVDERNYVFGYSSTNEERRAELRAGRDYRRGRYDVQLTHSAYAYDVPDAGVGTDTASDLLLADGRVEPIRGLTLDVNARGSRFVFGVGGQSSTVRGAGGGASVRYEFPGHLSASGRYSFSTNTLASALSGSFVPGEGIAPLVDRSQLTARTFFHDSEGRLEYAGNFLTAAAVLKDASYGVPGLESPTLATLRTAGGLLHVHLGLGGTDLRAGADAAFGTAGSNQGARQPYRESGIEAGMSQQVGGWLRVAIDAAVRTVDRLVFFPVNLEAKTATISLEARRPAWARLRASLTGVDNRRDIMFSDARDRHIGYTFGLGGPRYDLSVDVNRSDSQALLLSPDILGSRPDVAALIVSRPELLQNLLASADRTRSASLVLRPLDDLQIQARLSRQDQSYPGVFGLRMNGAQVLASWQLRDLHLELGWELFDSWTTFGTVRDRRLYLRLRRDLNFLGGGK